MARKIRDEIFDTDMVYTSSDVNIGKTTIYATTKGSKFYVCPGGEKEGKKIHVAIRKKGGYKHSNSTYDNYMMDYKITSLKNGLGSGSIKTGKIFSIDGKDLGYHYVKIDDSGQLYYEHDNSHYHVIEITDTTFQRTDGMTKRDNHVADPIEDPEPVKDPEPIPGEEPKMSTKETPYMRMKKKKELVLEKVQSMKKKYTMSDQLEQELDELVGILCPPRKYGYQGVTHFDEGKGVKICPGRHSKTINLTKDKKKVTCSACLGRMAREGRLFD